MNYRTYTNVKALLEEYKYRKFSGKISLEELFEITNCRSEDELYSCITREEISIAEECLKSGKCKEYLMELVQKDFSEMSSEELEKTINEYLCDIYYDDVIKAFPNKRFLLDNIEKYGYDRILRCIDEKEIFDYINENGKTSGKIIDYGLGLGNTTLLADAMQSIKSDYIKAKMLVKNGQDVFLPNIKKQYYRMQIVKSSDWEYDFDKEELLEQMNEYNVHFDNLGQIKEEENRAKYISQLDDNDMKEAFLANINKKENRDLIIKSFKRNVDPRIASLDQLTQTMIREYFEDTLGDKFTEDKKERLELVFNRTMLDLENLNKIQMVKQVI